MLVANVPAPAPAPAPGPPAGRPFEFGDILWPALWLAGTILLAAMIYKIIAVIRAYQQRKAAAADSAQGQLSQFRLAFERGEMTEEEYNRVYKLLTGQPRKKASPPGTQPLPPPDNASGNGQQPT